MKEVLSPLKWLILIPVAAFIGVLWVLDKIDRRIDPNYRKWYE